MLEILQDFEQMAARFSPSVLIGTGVVAVLVGLFIWLGGLGLKRVLVALAGAISGGIFGLCVSGQNVVWAMVSAALAAIIAVIFERVFVTILAAALAGAIGLAILAGPYIESSQALDEMSPQATTISLDESIEQLKAYAVDVGQEMKQASSQMPVYKWSIIAALAVIFVVGGFTLWRLTSALCFSVLGTMLVFVGMTLLLLYKGAAPIGHICSKPLIYAAVFMAMTGFGTIEQLLLCRRIKPRSARKSPRDSIRRKAGKDKSPGRRGAEGADRPERGWRTT